MTAAHICMLLLDSLSFDNKFVIRKNSASCNDPEGCALMTMTHIPRFSCKQKALAVFFCKWIIMHHSFKTHPREDKTLIVYFTLKIASIELSVNKPNLVLNNDKTARALGNFAIQTSSVSKSSIAITTSKLLTQI